jgi:glutamine amidotransferase
VVESNVQEIQSFDARGWLGVRVGIVDTGVSNTRSITRAVCDLGLEPIHVDEPRHLVDLDRIVIPGVGSFPAAMSRLRASGIAAKLPDFVDRGGRLLGICLGMQLLFGSSEEGGHTSGLGLLRGRVTALGARPGSGPIHMGWNNLTRTKFSPSFEVPPDSCDFYFVHGYHVVDCDQAVIAAYTDWHGQIVAAVQSASITGLQFHPEKSQDCGREILKSILAS